jgi:hypothetical protein
VTELGHRLGLNLADTLTCNAINLADFIESLRLAISKTEAHRYNARFTLRESVKHRVELLLKQCE